MTKDSRLGFGFGVPKALPGQPGYKQRPSTKLEQDARVMESRLAKLRMDLLQEQQKRDQDLPLKHAGNRWRSARPDRGSVSTYAKDVHDRMQHKDKNKATRKTVAAASVSSLSTSNSNSSSSSSTASSSTTSTSWSERTAGMDPAQWQNQHVLQWLTTLGLEELQSCFEFHQVTGRELVHLTLLDLTRMGVTRPEVCDRILHHVNKLQQTATMEKSQQKTKSKAKAKAKAAAAAPAEISDPKLHEAKCTIALEPGTQGQGQIHWSQAKPLANPTSCQHEDVVVNLADGDFDEAASHESFLKALLDWRDGGKESSTSAAIEDQDQLQRDTDDLAAIMWVNPMANSPSDDDNQFQRSSDSSRRSNRERERGGGGALLLGSYDEDQERLAFQRAVQAWRQGNTSSSTPETMVKPVCTEQSSANSLKKSCWHCYRVCLKELMVHNDSSSKDFCSLECQSGHQREMARFHKPQQAEEDEEEDETRPDT